MSGGEYVQLKWNSHHAAFLSNLSNLRDKQVLTDVMLSCEEQFYPAHRLVLSSCSSYFSRALEVTTCPQPVLMLHGIKQATLEHLLMYMYDGQVTISRTLLPELLRAGRWLGVKGLEDTGDLPPNLADDTSASQAPQTVSQMAQLVTQIFSSMASSLGVGDSSSVDSLTNVLVHACEKRAKADQLSVTQNSSNLSDLTQSQDQLDSSMVSLISDPVSHTPDIVWKVGQQPDKSQGLDEQSGSNSCIEPDDDFTFQPKVSNVSSLSTTEEVGEFQTHEECSNTSELQMDLIGEQQDIKMVPSRFDFGDQEDNTIIPEQFAEREMIESSEQEIPSVCEGASAIAKASQAPEQQGQSPAISLNLTDMVVLPRIEIQPLDEMNVIYGNEERNEERKEIREGSVKFPCGNCGKGVGSNSIQCTGCKKWCHRKCSGVKSLNKARNTFRCPTCVREEREENEVLRMGKDENTETIVDHGRSSPTLSVMSETNSFEGWEEGKSEEAAVTANLKALQNLITEALHYREHTRATSHHTESNIAISPVKIDRNTLKCRKCHQKFRLRIELKQHMRRVHNREMVCSICNKSFRNQSSYERHANTHSTEDGNNLRDGNRATTKITSINVEDLAVRTTRKAALHHSVIPQPVQKMGSGILPLNLGVKNESEKKIRQHKPSKHNRRTFTCAVCSKTFSALNKEIYLAHLSKHRKKTVKKKIVSAIKSKRTNYVRCQYCPFKGLNYQQVNGHMRVHVSDLPLRKKDSTIKTKTPNSVPCPYCPFKGESKQVVNGHVKVHFADLPFRCHKCLFRSSTRPTLLLHIKKKHPEVPKPKQDTLQK